MTSVEQGEGPEGPRDAVDAASRVEILEARGWTVDAAESRAKAAALAAMRSLPPSQPVGSVTYVSHGNLLVLGGKDAGIASRWAEALSEGLSVTLLLGVGQRVTGKFTEWNGEAPALAGHLGDFTLSVARLSVAGNPARATAEAKFDLVLDLGEAPAFTMPQPPQGYFRPGAAARLDLLHPESARLIGELRSAVGEFEKPRYFRYRANLCAHARSGVVGCSACIDVCSTRAVSEDGDGVRVDPFLCMGCGACATVCPSGAMGYQFPRPSDRGTQIRRLLEAHRAAGGREPFLLFHSVGEGRELISGNARDGRGLPPNVIALDAWHVAAIGMDLLLPAIAYGASGVAVLCARMETAEYRAALREQMAIAQQVVTALGYAGCHFVLVEATEGQSLAREISGLAPAQPVAQPATFALPDDKRQAVEFALEHLLRHAPTPRAEIPLARGAPYGEVVVNRETCTLCLACAGACPESALMDGVDRPMLRFLERNCVQCGLCERTCPEDAISLRPRLLLGAPAREARTLHEAEPFHCVKCGKPFGTRQAVDAMAGRLAGHPMFSQPGALERLRMCADCRVVAMMSSSSEASVLKL